MSRAEGTWGEAQVANFLRRRGYQLLAHSYHCRFGEVDLIARQGSVLCFVEVKTRTNLSVGLPREYVTRQKQEKLRRTAGVLSRRARTGLPRALRRRGGLHRHGTQRCCHAHRISGRCVLR